MRWFGWFRRPKPKKHAPVKKGENGELDELAKRRFYKQAKGTLIHVWYTPNEVSWSYPSDWDDVRGLGRALVNIGYHMQSEKK